MSDAIQIALSDDAATEALGHRLAALLRPGDLVLLQGNLGMGKTALARAIIQHLAGAAIDVPSPTFVLVLPYDLPSFPVTHIDLYRLSDPSEVDELGLWDALEDGIALVEWPEILGTDLPETTVRICLSESGQGRRADLSGSTGMMERFDGI